MTISPKTDRLVSVIVLITASIILISTQLIPGSESIDTILAYGVAILAYMNFRKACERLPKEHQNEDSE